MDSEQLHTLVLVAFHDAYCENIDRLSQDLAGMTDPEQIEQRLRLAGR